jgi:hypothetical protein
MTMFVAGLLVMGYAVAALYFGRFYRQSGDRLFLFFASGFALLALQRLSLASAAMLPLPFITYYVLRLAAFVVILLGILDKNRAR